MTTGTEIAAETREKGAGEQLTELARSLAVNSNRLFTPLAGVVVGVLGLLVIAGLYAHSWNELNKARAAVDESRDLLSVPGPDLPDPDQQLIAWESVLSNAVEARTAESVDSEFVETVLSAALDTGVTLITASAQREVVVELDGREYGASPYLLRVSGEISGVQAFLRKLEGGLFETLEVSSSVVTRDDDDFLASIGVVVRNEIVGDGVAEDGVPTTSGDEPVSVDSRSADVR